MISSKTYMVVKLDQEDGWKMSIEKKVLEGAFGSALQTYSILEFSAIQPNFYSKK